MVFEQMLKAQNQKKMDFSHIRFTQSKREVAFSYMRFTPPCLQTSSYCGVCICIAQRRKILRFYFRYLLYATKPINCRRYIKALQMPLLLRMAQQNT